MLVIHGVKLRVLDQSHEVWELERDCSVGFERAAKTGGKVVDIRHVGIHVVADDEVGLLSCGGEPLRNGLAEELAKNRNVEGLRRGGGACGRFNAKTGYARGDEMPEQVTVVCADLEHEAIGAKTEPRPDHFRISNRMIAPGFGH